MDAINDFIVAAGGTLFSDPVVYVIVATGILFTIWSGFGQWRSLTHGVAVVRGKYDEDQDPGAINHFQALSTALSATVGLGNIAGVGIAIATGGPGAIFWMWVIGIVGMALKMTEVTQSMLYRDTRDPANPHGGPMFVVKTGLARAAGEGGRPGTLCIVAGIVFALMAVGIGYLSGSTIALVICALFGLVLLVLGFTSGAMLGYVIGALFVVTLLISAMTGGNMFQAWSVAETTQVYFGINSLVTGIILAVITGAVILGGIRWIGRVTSVLVPVMCGVYVLVTLVVLAINIDEIPGMFAMIIKSGLGIETASASGAFVGGAFGFAFTQGMKRALFSSESGQGSAPIAHSAARTDEPVREGIVGGLEPFIDTLVVCTMTALLILATGALEREPEGTFASANAMTIIADGDDYTIADTPLAELPPRSEEARTRMGYTGETNYAVGDKIAVLLQGDDRAETGTNLYKLVGVVRSGESGPHVEWESVDTGSRPSFVLNEAGGFPLYGEYVGSTLTAHAFDRVQPGLGKWLIVVTIWLFAVSTIISWSYYGEQGVVFLFGEKATLPYKFVYLAFTLVACWPGLFVTVTDIDNVSILGLGTMLVVNIPIMLIFGPQAMRAYHDYFRRFKQGPMHDEIRDDGTTPEQNIPGP